MKNYEHHAMQLVLLYITEQRESVNFTHSAQRQTQYLYGCSIIYYMMEFGIEYVCYHCIYLGVFLVSVSVSSGLHEEFRN